MRAPAVMRIAAVMMRTTVMDMIVSKRDYFNPSALPHVSLTVVACMKKLYGTTVVPIRAMIINMEPFGMPGMNAPFSTSAISGPDTIIVVMKVTHITAMRKSMSFSMIL